MSDKHKNLLGLIVSYIILMVTPMTVQFTAFHPVPVLFAACLNLVAVFIVLMILGGN